jgi:hypothetical protein
MSGRGNARKKPLGENCIISSFIFVLFADVIRVILPRNVKQTDM